MPPKPDSIIVISKALDLSYEENNKLINLATQVKSSHQDIPEEVLVYCGIITYHKEYTPDYLKQKKIKNYGDIEYLTVKGKHTPIVTEEEFYQVQKIMDTKSRKMKNLNTGKHKVGYKPHSTAYITPKYFFKTSLGVRHPRQILGMLFDFLLYFAPNDFKSKHRSDELKL